VFVPNERLLLDEPAAREPLSAPIEIRKNDPALCKNRPHDDWHLSVCASRVRRRYELSTSVPFFIGNSPFVGSLPTERTVCITIAPVEKGVKVSLALRRSRRHRSDVTARDRAAQQRSDNPLAMGESTVHHEMDVNQPDETPVRHER